MKFIKFLLKYKAARRLIDSVVKNYFLARNIDKIYLDHKNIKLEINMGDSFDRVFLFKGYWENEQINYLLDYAKEFKSEYFVDVGSNSGLYSLIFSKNIPDIKILSFEPITKTYEKQLRNFNLNNLNKNITIHNIGLSNFTGESFFETKISYNYKQSSTYKVSKTGEEKSQLNKFDNIVDLKNKKLIIKIDVEGHEKEVLEGMLKSINLNSILLQIEIFDENFDAVNEILVNNKFIYIQKIKSDYFYKNN